MPAWRPPNGAHRELLGAPFMGYRQHRNITRSFLRPAGGPEDAFIAGLGFRLN